MANPPLNRYFCVEKRPWTGRDLHATWGNEGGGKKKRYWFGYLVHLDVDAKDELPIAFTVTNASAAERPSGSLSSSSSMRWVDNRVDTPLP